MTSCVAPADQPNCGRAINFGLANDQQRPPEQIGDPRRSITCIEQTYLCMTGLPIGLLFDFHAPRLKNAMQRFAK
jgi:hypothetical protein